MGVNRVVIFITLLIVILLLIPLSVVSPSLLRRSLPVESGQRGTVCREGMGRTGIRIKSKSKSKIRKGGIATGYSTVTAIRNGADLLIVETKSKVAIFTPGRGFSRLFR
jgi:hypothetical protein